MDETITIVCPECATRLRALADIEGKKVKCKKCGESFTAHNVDQAHKPAKPAGKGAPAAKPRTQPKPQPKPAARKDDEDEEEGSDPYGITTIDLTPRCPHCANEMEEGDIICLHCGYNTETREQGRTRKVVDQTPMDHFLWLLPGILCVLFIILTIIWDIVYCLNASDWFEGAWYEFLAHQSIKMWMCIISIFMMVPALTFAIKRLIINNQPPEIERN